MALLGMAPEQMKPTALVLNLVVGTIALIQFARAGCFSWRLFWPFALGAAPFAYLGGSLTVSGSLYRLAAAARLALPSTPLSPSQPMRQPSLLTASISGGVIGLVAGITGTGGGIYLSPLLILCRWGEPRETGGVAAAFILVNSLAGLIGHHPDLTQLPAALPL